MPTLVDISSDPKYIQQCHRKNFLSWGRGMTEDQYVERERGIARIFGENNMKYYAFFDDNNQIVSACEILTRPGIRNVGNQVINIDFCTVGGVYTPSEYRGKGYAKEMLSQVVNKTVKNDEAVILYSDVGNFYAQFGFHLKDATSLEYSVAGKQADHSTEYILIDDSSQFHSIAHLLTENILSRVQSGPEGATALLPTVDVLRYFLWRGKCYHVNSDNMTSGARLSNAFDAPGILWFYDFGNKVLKVVAIAMPSRLSMAQKREATIKLLQAAKNEAIKFGLNSVYMWKQDAPEALENADWENEGWKFSERKTSLPAIHRNYPWVHGFYSFF